jgi:hypothetical protein
MEVLGPKLHYTLCNWGQVLRSNNNLFYDGLQNGEGIAGSKTAFSFTPLESPSIYAGDVRNRKPQLLIEDGLKTLPFLTGFISLMSFLFFDPLIPNIITSMVL